MNAETASVLYTFPFRDKSLPTKMQVNITAALDIDGADPASKVNVQMISKMKTGWNHFLKPDDLKTLNNPSIKE